MEHGPAPFQHQQGNSPSWFVSLRDASGSVKTHWGLDLERALEASGAKVGDQVRLARLSRQRVQVREPIRDQTGTVIDHAIKETERNAWSVTVDERAAPGQAGRHGAARQDQGPREGLDPIAARVVEVFTSQRLVRLAPEDRVRFRELYDQAKARLELGGRHPGPPPVPANENPHERTIQGR